MSNQEQNIYQANGFNTRVEYLNSLAEGYGIPVEMVYELANVLGATEDFDGLVTSLEDYEGEF